MDPSLRPPLNAAMSGEDLMRWYWLRNELTAFARDLGISTAGNKEALQARIAAQLDGRPLPARMPTGRAGPCSQLTGPLTAQTRVPRGQRCSQHLRAWFEDRLGPSFRFDAEMRRWFAGTDGTATLADAVAHWQATRGTASTQIDRQFEFNRFTRTWHATHPEGTREQLLIAWRDYRAQPVDVRGRA